VEITVLGKFKIGISRPGKLTFYMQHNLPNLTIHKSDINVNLTISFKGLLHPKMKILSVFTHPHVVSNIYVFICSAEHKGRYLEECINQTHLNPH